MEQIFKKLLTKIFGKYFEILCLDLYRVVSATAAAVELTSYLCRTMLCINTTYAVMQCLPVCPCVCHVCELCQNE